MLPPPARAYRPISGIGSLDWSLHMLVHTYVHTALYMHTWPNLDSLLFRGPWAQVGALPGLAHVFNLHTAASVCGQPAGCWYSVQSVARRPRRTRHVSRNNAAELCQNMSARCCSTRLLPGMALRRVVVSGVIREPPRQPPPVAHVGAHTYSHVWTVDAVVLVVGGGCCQLEL